MSISMERNEVEKRAVEIYQGVLKDLQEIKHRTGLDRDEYIEACIDKYKMNLMESDTKSVAIVGNLPVFKKWMKKNNNRFMSVSESGFYSDCAYQFPGVKIYMKQSFGMPTTLSSTVEAKEIKAAVLSEKKRCDKLVSVTSNYAKLDSEIRYWKSIPKSERPNRPTVEINGRLYDAEIMLDMCYVFSRTYAEYDSSRKDEDVPLVFGDTPIVGVVYPIG